MARPVDYRKGRGSKGVHTEDEQVPIGKKGQGRNSDSNAQKNAPPDKAALEKSLLPLTWDAATAALLKGMGF